MSDLDEQLTPIKLTVRMTNGDEFLLRQMPKIEADSLLDAYLNHPEIDTFHIVMAYGDGDEENVYLQRQSISSVHTS